MYTAEIRKALILKGKTMQSRYVEEWVVINNGAGKPYPIRIKHNDTNGTVVNYYWNEADSTLGRKTMTDTIMRNFSITEIRYPGFPMWIYGRDDDSLIAGGRFVVFADSAPPTPQPFNPIANADSTVTLRWANYDIKDGKDSTSFQIYIGYNGTAPATLLINQKGAKFGWDRNRYLYSFKPTQQAFSWKIRTTDARQSVSECSRQDYAP
jgi:hypothetical protein